MSQRSIFDDGAPVEIAHPMARTTDPSSSHDAAEQMEASGAARQQRERCVDLVFLNPGLTSKQLAEKCEDLDRYQIARRLPEAEREGSVERRNPTSKGKEVTWWPK